MSRRCLSVLLVLPIILAALPAATATASNGRRPVRSLLGIVLPGYHANHQALSIGLPVPHRYYAHKPGGYPPSGYNLGAPTYNWGYFGARHCPDWVSHTDYYGDYVQHSYRQGY